MIRPAGTRWLWALLALYALARPLQAFPDRIPMAAIVALHVLPALAFAVVHGAMTYGWRGIALFVLLCVVIGNISENLGVATGFPFGHYHFTDAMGPKIFAVPILLGLAYIGMGYVSWTVARAIAGDGCVRLLPLAAAFVMVAWDFSMDPIWSNLIHLWVWHDGGAFFGVPATNFFGWYLTDYLIYQSFAWMAPQPRRSSPRTAVLFYAACALGNLFVLAGPAPAVVSDAAGVPWRVSAILGASALVSIFVMGAFAVLAWARTTPPQSP